MKHTVTVYCGWMRNTEIKVKPKICKDVAFEIKCIECNGTGIFDCGIEEERGTCICCKGTGKQLSGL